MSQEVGRRQRGQKTVFHAAADKRYEDGAELAKESSLKCGAGRKTMIGGRRQSYQHMANDYIKQAILRAKHDEAWSAHRIFLLHLLDSPWYCVGIGIVIVLNILLVIHEVDSLASGGVPVWVTHASSVFLGIYVLEVVTRFYVYRLGFFRNAWNVLDLTVVVTDIVAEVANLWGMNELPSVSFLRIFRLVRLVRLIAMLAVFDELQTLLLGFASAMKAIFWASMMIGMVLTSCSICAVVFIHPLNVKVAETGVYQGCERCGRAFETVAESNLTFIQQIIAGDSWGKVTIPIIDANPLAGFFFLLVFGVIDLGVINLVLMVIVNAAERAREANQDMQFRKKVGEIEETKLRLKMLCNDLDTNDDGRISLKEWQDGLDRNEELRKAMAGLDVQRQDAEIIFYLMDEDKSGDVDFHEFVGTLVSTKHESLNTKLLFLKASIHQIYKDLMHQEQVIEEEVVVPMASTEDVEVIVKTIHDDASSKIYQQWNEIMSECQSLTQKLDQRWEQLQLDQVKIYHVLERVLDEMLPSPPSSALNQLQSEVRSSIRESALPNLSLPPAAVPGKAEQPNRPQWCRYLCNPKTPGSTLRCHSISATGCDSDNDHLQNGLGAAQSVLSGSSDLISHSARKMSSSNAENNFNSNSSWDIVNVKRKSSDEKQLSGRNLHS